MMHSPYVVTTDTVAGYTVVRAVAFVIGSHVIPLSPYHNEVKSLATGRTVPIERLKEIVGRARSEAVRDLMRNAQYQGGNAVVGVRFDTRPLTSSWYEILAYGTAVLITPNLEPIEG